MKGDARLRYFAPLRNELDRNTREEKHLTKASLNLRRQKRLKIDWEDWSHRPLNWDQSQIHRFVSVAELDRLRATLTPRALYLKLIAQGDETLMEITKWRKSTIRRRKTRTP